ncbi:IclR family transcriptional regulator [Streptomyces sp. CA-181903]|uniref:IclR family transcriptional regulator n=1 Tax=Streptomyces sp. CA-181903 TaxID=3240055 RepID=UPI003D942EE5
MPQTPQPSQTPQHRAPVGTTAAVLELLAREPERGVSFRRLTASLGLPDHAVGDVISGLRAEGLVEYDAGSGTCRPGAPLRRNTGPSAPTRPDCNDVRAAAMIWADGLAARTGMSVLLAVAHPEGAQVIHHVFRPDNRPQRLATGDVLPHTSAPARVLAGPCDDRCVYEEGPGPEEARLATSVPCPDGVRHAAALCLTGPRRRLDPNPAEAAEEAGPWRCEEALRDAARTVSSALVGTPSR